MTVRCCVHGDIVKPLRATGHLNHTVVCRLVSHLVANIFSLTLEAGPGNFIPWLKYFGAEQDYSVYAIRIPSHWTGGFSCDRQGRVPTNTDAV